MAALSPAAAVAQPRSGPSRVVILSAFAPPDHVRAFEEGLHALGYTPGGAIAIDHRPADTIGALPAVAQDAARLQPQVIVGVGTSAGLAAKQATKDIPIIVVAGDVTASGLVRNLGRPEANVTGLSFFAVDLMLKRFDLLMELAPKARRIAVLVQAPATPTTTKSLDALRAAARPRGVEVRALYLARGEEIGATLATLREPTVNAVLVVQAPIFDVRADEIGGLTVAYRLVAMLPWKDYVQAGGLIAYAPDILALWRRAATYVDRILRGAKPADLPVEQPTKFELAINVKTSKVLGLTVPPALLLRADLVLD